MPIKFLVLGGGGLGLSEVGGGSANFLWSWGFFRNLVSTKSLLLKHYLAFSKKNPGQSRD